MCGFLDFAGPRKAELKEPSSGLNTPRDGAAADANGFAAKLPEERIAEASPGSEDLLG